MENLLAIVITVNAFLLLCSLVVAFVVGYILRSALIKKCRKRIMELEKEMLRDNAKILELEKEKADLLKNQPYNS